MRQVNFTDDERRELREELLRVRKQAGEIDRAHMPVEAQIDLACQDRRRLCGSPQEPPANKAAL